MAVPAHEGPEQPSHPIHDKSSLDANLPDREKTEFSNGYLPASCKNARVLLPDQFNALKDVEGITDFTFTSGFFAPGHPGHFELARESQSMFGKPVVVCVNGDSSLLMKHGFNFMDLGTRAEVMKYITGGDYIVPFEIENDRTMIVPLRTLNPTRFTKGGDRHSGEIPETPTCEELNIEVVNGVGGAFKMASSSDFLKQFAAAIDEDPIRFVSDEPTWIDGHVEAPCYVFSENNLPDWMSRVSTDDVLERSARRRAHAKLVKDAVNPAQIGSLEEVAPVMLLDHFNTLARGMNLGKIVVVAGDFNPVTPYQLEQLQRAKLDGDTLVALVSSDEHVMRGYEGTVFQPLPLRAQTMSYVRGVDFVIPTQSRPDLDRNDRNFDSLVSAIEHDSFHVLDESEDPNSSRALLVRFADFLRRNETAFR